MTRKARSPFALNLGTGKTFTMAISGDSPGRVHAGSGVLNRMFVYCIYRNQEQTIGKLLCSLLQALLQMTSAVPDQVVALYEKLKPAGQTYHERKGFTAFTAIRN